MRNSVVLRLASVAAFAFVAGSVMSSPASAFIGLSDKQAAHIEKYIKCKTYLLKGDLESFSADPDCGKGHRVVESLTYGMSGGKPREEEHCYPEWPNNGLTISTILECPIPQ